MKDNKQASRGMTGSEYEEAYRKSYHFFLSELKGLDPVDLAFLVELMRCSQHIKDMRKLILHMHPEDMPEEEEMVYWVENDSLITMTLNLCAAQLREALKLFWKFSSRPYFKELVASLSPEMRAPIDELVRVNDEVAGKSGFVYDVLDPVRISMFHYLPDRALPWLEKTRAMEAERKPPMQGIDIAHLDFGPGKEYDRDIFWKYLFWGDEGLSSLLKAQHRVMELQMAMLDASGVIIEAMLKKEGIPKRENGWFMEHFHGYKDKP